METTRNSVRNIVFIVGGTGLLLLIPLLGDWPWSGSDYVIMGILFIGTGLIYELLARRVESAKNRVILGALVLGAFLLIWAELAVGLFGTPFAGS